MNKTMRRFLLAALIALGLSTATLPVHAATYGGLVKLACPAAARPDHPCRAVYYLGLDGRRHAFPNADVYATWYRDFSGVTEIGAAALAAWPLGRNAPYRPGSRLVKLATVPTVYAVGEHATLRPIPSESAAAALAGADWARQVADLPDVFFLDYATGAAIGESPAFDKASALNGTPDLNALLGASYRDLTVAGFRVRVITADRTGFRLLSAGAGGVDCLEGCAAKPLRDYAEAARATLAIHGSYFCPPDYASCVGTPYAYRWPLLDSADRRLLNESELKYHEGPLLAATEDGRLHLWRDARVFTSLGDIEAATGSAVTAALANYPTLIIDGVQVVETEPRLDDGQRTVKGRRGGIGWDDERFFLVIADNATVPDLAAVMAELGATNAMNLDGGGSSALLFGAEYKVGPGRLLPNALLLAPR
jgi:hypothetical protein